MLRQQDVATLEQMHDRLTVSMQHLEESLHEMEKENKALTASNAEAQATVSSLLGCLGHLSINGSNCPAPQLEGDSVLKKADRLVSRALLPTKQMGVRVNNHVGELAKRPEPPHVEALGYAKEWGFQALSAGKSLWASAQKAFEPEPKRRPKRRPRPQKKQEAPEPDDQCLGQLDPTVAVAQEDAERWADTVEATLLLEVQIDVGDGNVQKLEVRAADRLTEVAQRFVEEQGLKKCFEAPLLAFLRQVEDDADAFPVSARASLADIFAQHG